METFGKYRLTRRLAYGGMAEVFLATVHGEAGFAKPVVIKRLHPRFNADSEFVSMLIDEARITAQLTHSNICQVLDLGAVDGSYFIAMEHISGEDLRGLLQDYIRRKSFMPVEAAVFIMCEALAGLHYAHTREDANEQALKIIHRDVSPHNILISYEGEVKVIDFGIAKARMRMVHTRAGVIKGKFRYMSPEQASGGEIDARTDVFAAGVVLYELLRGEPHLTNIPDTDVLRRMRDAALDPLTNFRSDLDRQLVAIVEKALARKTRKRYADASAFRAALVQYQRESLPSFGRAELAELMQMRFSTKRRRERSGSLSGDLGPPPVDLDTPPRRPIEATAAVGDPAEEPRPAREAATSIEADGKSGHLAYAATFASQESLIDARHATGDSDGEIATAPRRQEPAAIDQARTEPNPADYLPPEHVSTVIKPGTEHAVTEDERSAAANRRDRKGRGERGALRWSSKYGGGRQPRDPTAQEQTAYIEEDRADRRAGRRKARSPRKRREGPGIVRRTIGGLATLVLIGVVLVLGAWAAFEMGLWHPSQIGLGHLVGEPNGPKTPRLDAGDPVDAGRVVAKAEGHIRVVTRPAGARIYLCGEPVGEPTPTIVSVAAGTDCTLELRLRGYAPYSLPVQVEAGRTLRVNTRLRRSHQGTTLKRPPPEVAEPTQGKLLVTSLRVGTVYVNGRAVGSTPRLLVSLDPGTYTVQVSFTTLGTDSAVRQVVLRAGERTKLHFEADQ